MKIEVCKGQAGIALYVDDKRVAGQRHNGLMKVVLSAEVATPPKAPIDAVEALRKARPYVEMTVTDSFYNTGTEEADLAAIAAALAAVSQSEGQP